MFKIIGRQDGIVRTVYAFYRSNSGSGSVWFLIFVNNDWRWVDPCDYVPFFGKEDSSDA